MQDFIGLRRREKQMTEKSTARRASIPLRQEREVRLRRYNLSLPIASTVVAMHQRKILVRDDTVVS